LASIATKKQRMEAMPHPKNRLKLTGDTHLPDIGDLLERADADEPAVLEFDAEPRVYADGWAPSGPEALPAEEHALPEPVDAGRTRRGETGGGDTLAGGRRSPGVRVPGCEDAAEVGQARPDATLAKEKRFFTDWRGDRGKAADGHHCQVEVVEMG
jgi:hypothetical protein